jgi:Mu-like prophage I protein
MTLTFDDSQTATLLEALGLSPDADEPDVIMATVADLAAQAAGITADKPSTIAAAAKKAGLEVIDTDTADALRRDAAEGRKIAAAAARAKVEAAVDDAINDGKITPSRRKHWVSLIEADPGMAEVLAAMPNETAVPLTELWPMKRPRS